MDYAMTAAAHALCTRMPPQEAIALAGAAGESLAGAFGISGT